MCFGKKLSQDEPGDCMSPFPTPNNFCGGFALNAVLVDLGRGTCPIEVYIRIQDYQNTEIIKKNPKSAASIYLQNNESSGTRMSLPSGICAAFKNYVTDRTVTVCYSSNFAEGPFKNLIGEEISRITGEVGMEIQVLDGLYPETIRKYVLVLVDNKHWIAVKKEKDSFTCYDPATGEAKPGNSMIAAIQELGYKPESINGLYICIS